MPRFRASRVALVLIGGTYAWVVAGTRPFSAPADAGVAVGFAAVGTLAARSLARRHRRTSGGTGASAGATAGAVVDAPPVPEPAGLVRAWVAAAVIIAALELATYLAGLADTRDAFPTVSSLYDEAAASTAAKAVVVFAWMALGWGLFRR
jgi:hypothetical protein